MTGNKFSVCGSLTSVSKATERTSSWLFPKNCWQAAYNISWFWPWIFTCKLHYFSYDDMTSYNVNWLTQYCEKQCNLAGINSEGNSTVHRRENNNSSTACNMSFQLACPHWQNQRLLGSNQTFWSSQYPLLAKAVLLTERWIILNVKLLAMLAQWTLWALNTKCNSTWNKATYLFMSFSSFFQ